MRIQSHDDVQHGEKFEFLLNKSNLPKTALNADSTLKAEWAALDEKSYLQFEDIAKAFGFSPPEIPQDLDLSLKSASFTYDFTNKTLVLEAQSANYGKAIFVAVNANQTWQYFFGLEIDKPINLTNLPLIDDLVPAEDTVEIDGIQVVISSAAVDNNLATQINALIDDGYPKVPNKDQQGMPEGLNFSMNVNLGGTLYPIILQTSAKQAQNAPLPIVSSSSTGNITTATSSDGVHWFNIQKTFGPISLQKMGVQYKDGRIILLVNASLTASGLTIGLVGFGVGSSIKTFDPVFSIQGIDVTYSNGGVEISGGLLGTFDPPNFIGELMLSAESLTIAGLAGYSSLSGNPSLFLYAVLDYPIGGPAFCFVTGLAAGFGYNRNLLIPDVSGVANFPLIQWAQGINAPPMDMKGDIGAQVNQALQSLQDSGIIAPSLGQYWVAFGLKFTSFKLVDSFALAVIKFGSDFEIDILGTSSVSIPPDMPSPVAYAELELLVSFKPDSGLLAISGQLTPNSYVLSQACHLSGGFAYYFWFAKENAGNFVMTLGGYNPHFNPPNFYPKVPRLAINWQVSNELIVKGDEYFALTSRAIMAGGGLSATWSSGPISAWFDVQADFLIAYLPFHYYISASVSIGASFSIDLLFCSITITIHVGADLEIWGPEFAGVATVDLDIISFTIRFNDHAQSTQTTISWSDFVKQLLPGTSSSEALIGADISDSMLSINVSKGLNKKLSDDGTELDFVVNAEQFEMIITTTIPSKTFSATNLLNLADGQPSPNTNFGCGPTGTDDQNFTSALVIDIRSLSSSKHNGSAIEPELDAFYILSNVPKSFWEKTEFDGNHTPIISDPLNDTLISNVMTGIKIVPKIKTPDHTLPIDLEDLEYTIDDNIQHFMFGNGWAPTSDPFSKETVQDSIMSTIAQNNRNKILNAANQIVPFINFVDVQNLACTKGYDLMSEPVLSLLGEDKA